MACRLPGCQTKSSEESARPDWADWGVCPNAPLCGWVGDKSLKMHGVIFAFYLFGWAKGSSVSLVVTVLAQRRGSGRSCSGRNLETSQKGLNITLRSCATLCNMYFRMDCTSEGTITFKIKHHFSGSQSTSGMYQTTRSELAGLGTSCIFTFNRPGATSCKYNT